MSVAVEIADLAAEQWGLVTTAQARAQGISVQAVARLAKQGVLERTTHGVYRVTGAPPEQLDDLRAAWLTLDPARMAEARRRGPSTPAVVSHRSAARVHELGDLEADELEFTTPGRKQSRRDDVRLHRGAVGPGEWTVVDGLPVTTVVRTIADLAAARVDGGHLGRVVRDALTVHQVDDQQLIAVLRPHAHCYGERVGDGAALVATFLRAAGVSTSLERAVELADVASVVRGVPSVSELAGIQRTMELIQRQIAPVLRVSELLDADQVRRAAALSETAQEALTGVDTEQMRKLQEAVSWSIDRKQMSRIEETLAGSIDSEQMRRIRETLAGSIDPAALRAISEITGRLSDLVSSPQLPAIEAAVREARALDQASADDESKSNEGD